MLHTACAVPLCPLAVIGNRAAAATTTTTLRFVLSFSLFVHWNPFLDMFRYLSGARAIVPSSGSSSSSNRSRASHTLCKAKKRSAGRTWLFELYSDFPLLVIIVYVCVCYYFHFHFFFLLRKTTIHIYRSLVSIVKRFVLWPKPSARRHIQVKPHALIYFFYFNLFTVRCKLELVHM